MQWAWGTAGSCCSHVTVSCTPPPCYSHCRALKNCVNVGMCPNMDRRMDSSFKDTEFCFRSGQAKAHSHKQRVIFQGKLQPKHSFKDRVSRATQEGRKSQRHGKTEEYVAWEGEVTLDIGKAKTRDGLYTMDCGISTSKTKPDTRESKQTGLELTTPSGKAGSSHSVTSLPQWQLSISVSLQL